MPGKEQTGIGIKQANAVLSPGELKDGLMEGLITMSQSCFAISHLVILNESDK